MKFALASGIAIALLSSHAQAAGNCYEFSSSCSDACRNSIDARDGAICNPYSAYCSCEDPYSKNPTEEQKKSFCDTMNSTCTNTMCGSEKYVDSFYCDKWTFNSQCLCTNESNMKGGPLLTKAGEDCIGIFTKCTQETCKGKGVLKNLCQNSADYECVCDDGTSTGRGELNGAESSNGLSFLLALGGTGALLAQILL